MNEKKIQKFFFLIVCFLICENFGPGASDCLYDLHYFGNKKSQKTEKRKIKSAEIM